MNRMVSKDWEGVDAGTQVSVGSEVAQAAVEFDWDSGDLRVLGRLMSKIGLDLATAVQVFLNGRPHEFNHMHKDDVPLEDSARCSMLDCLHRKISCGFYLPDPEIGLAPVRSEAEAWFARQRQDAAQGTQGRWVFDEAKFNAISDRGPTRIVMTPMPDSRPTLLRVLLDPIWS